jgi:hypothetical protein
MNCKSCFDSCQICAKWVRSQAGIFVVAMLQSPLVTLWSGIVVLLKLGSKKYQSRKSTRFVEGDLHFLSENVTPVKNIKGVTNSCFSNYGNKKLPAVFFEIDVSAALEIKPRFDIVDNLKKIIRKSASIGII